MIYVSLFWKWIHTHHWMDRTYFRGGDGDGDFIYYIESNLIYANALEIECTQINIVELTHLHRAPPEFIQNKFYA